MKIINEELLNELENYIYQFQLNNGRSPSYREILRSMNFSSLSSVSRYIDVLQSQGKIQKTNLGKIEFLFEDDTAKTVYAPIVGVVRCGAPIFAQENYEQLCPLPTEIFGRKELFILHAEGDSMEGVGIHDKDLLVVEKTNEAINGQIVVALIEDGATVKTFKKEKDKIILHPENEKYEDIVCQDVKILGIVKHFIHTL